VINIDSMPPPPPPTPSVLMNIPTIGIREGSFRNSLTTGRKIMDIQEVYFEDRVPLFNGSNFSHWSIRMRHFSQAHGFDIWKSILDGYTTPKHRPKGAGEKKLQKDNEMELNIILRGLSESENKINEVGKHSLTKELWDKL
jgi:hypothetical protein